MTSAIKFNRLFLDITPTSFKINDVNDEFVFTGRRKNGYSVVENVIFLFGCINATDI